MENDNLKKMRHSLAHIMAQAVLKLYPEAKLAIGPDIDNGFYYDFDLGQESFSPEALKKIEKQMKKIVAGNQKFEQYSLPISEAKEKLAANPYKVDLIEALEKAGETEIGFYKNIDGNGQTMFDDMCRGPHVSSTKGVGAFKVDKIAGAYWRGDENNKMLQRLYALAFATPEDLDNYLKMREEAEKRDHRKLAKELGLIVNSELVGPGLPLYTGKGAFLRRMIGEYSRELRERMGYVEVHTPQMNKAELFKKSGHYDKYKEDMFRVVSNYTDEEYFLKPMNCPQHTQIFASDIRSYKDLPVRIADFANLYRDEKPGELSGLTRLRYFAQDDGHCFCREDQIADEFSQLLDAEKETMETYGMTYYVRLGFSDKNNMKAYLGDEKVWSKAEELLEKLVKEKKVEYMIAEGDAAFYGPKMDIVAKDSLGRDWQLSTIQIDFNLPERFELEYIGEDGKKHRPVMIHSALVGSLERFMAVMIEHYAGDFPLWLTPVQVKLISVGEKHHDYVKDLAAKLKQEKIRVEIDLSDETVGNKIRKSEKEKNPYMLVIGDKEMETTKYTVRLRGEEEQRELTLEELIDEIKDKVENKK
ncbi:threonine--tRNA ligase [Candidatus Falkowbacteria bacterium CG10_big_fil_rev_8_21_14_0_10_39_11]|uniref:Threonine--tRNA ligase n=1 Tax=Candidatus Falkowbacteria bacterium CG10_big_fil_rev_8_21_14_0_10_39_11 TaxID=1974565 RepID=A0A2H0V6H4_9BACT|nr:MAG: threonine--tRNA ligase [Candidatus Falkowbacteria bacterium CG10_big_fil_rev_8_21_14_0_10_39_11]